MSGATAVRERRLWNAGAGEVIERYEREDEGECGNCHEPINRVVGSSYTNRRDRVRYARPGDTEGWGLFRCPNCEAVVDEHWRSSEAAR